MAGVERLLSLLGRVTSRLAIRDGYAEDARVDTEELLADEVRFGHH